jgi:uncharacterized membrane protein (UPF0182 family)
VFFNTEDQWDVPSIPGATTGGRERGAVSAEARMQPYYAVMRLPGEREAEFIQMLPFTPRAKDNLAAWMVSRSDGDKYGQLAVFKFPKQKLVFGPRQVVARINQDQVISPQITLWSQQGSQVIMGTLLVIPIEESLLYVRALYLKAETGRIPELKRVIVAHQNAIVMDETLEGAVDKLFGKSGAPGVAAVAAPTASAPAAPTGSTAPVEASRTDAALAAEALAHYERALAAQREGNWALYGEEIKKLGDVLKKMK